MFDSIKNKRSNVALVDEYGNSMTYGEIYQESEILKDCVESRSLIIIQCDHSIETVSLYFSMLELRLIPLLIDSKADDQYFKKMCELYHPQYIWVAEKKADSLSNYLSIEVIYSKNGYTLYRTNHTRYDIYPELALLLTTSGTTGSPSVVRLSYENLRHNIGIMENFLQLKESDTGITSLPIHHCYGLSILHLCWNKAAKVCLYNGTLLNPAYKNTIKKQNVTFTFLVPYSLDLIKMLGYIHAGFDNLHTILVGGGKLDDCNREVMKDFCKLNNINGFVAYGQTEGTCYFSTKAVDYVISSDDVGRLLPGLDFFIENPDIEGIGELVIKGGSVSLGYAGKYEDLILGDENRGILHTGDLAKIDKGGNIFLKGRLKRIVKILGERVSLDEVETYLHKEFGELEIACFDIENNLCIAHTGNVLYNETIKEFLSTKMKIHKQMISTYNVDFIPRFANGKTNYPKLRESIRTEQDN